MKEIEKRMMELARVAGDMILNTSPFIDRYKGSKENYSTTTDIEIQNYLREELLKLVPGSEFMGEEGDWEVENDNYVWIVDPIDGTVNYARHIPVSVVSIALVKSWETQIGVVYNPYLNEMYHSVRGGGSFLNDTGIHVSNNPKERSLVSLAWSVYNKDWSGYCFEISETLHRDCEDLRRMGSAAYEMCLLARGSTDMFFEMRLFPWDHAASSLIIEEAGGVCGSIDGPIDQRGQCTVLCGNNGENLGYLRDVVIGTIGEFRIPHDL